jgi:hypothetical protein
MVSSCSDSEGRLDVNNRVTNHRCYEVCCKVELGFDYEKVFIFGDIYF